MLRGRGCFRHAPAAFRRIRHDLRIAWPALTSWTASGLDLRQVTAERERTC
ncbi:hypothetical protein OHA84_37025 [Streptomyces sp. NBC_00513]|uniref:hypothetical protein n=1 Tax=unclassified Streptomyces TaxID=2593676 RepID=UPI0022575362|nr:hypothetical protein [Streptomyces sp. NBC_00424]MCX5078623.1 hypothetical protein [Streptomyces sp. NBC_00424]WUD39068.1 hypothetical protein OHA84_00275 [Streptomyces sp. NBC_00513]WUD45661.1 hypothetical protein OHA84_37025 [Streptomyces sp. NBC_00513]